jgi:hypothetical protein
VCGVLAVGANRSTPDVVESAALLRDRQASEGGANWQLRKVAQAQGSACLLRPQHQSHRTPKHAAAERKRSIRLACEAASSCTNTLPSRHPQHTGICPPVQAPLRRQPCTWCATTTMNSLSRSISMMTGSRRWITSR